MLGSLSRTQATNRIHGQLTGGIATGEVEKAVLAGCWHRHQRREQGAEGLAQACGGFQQKSAGLYRVFVHRLRQLALPGAKRGEGESKA